MEYLQLLEEPETEKMLSMVHQIDFCVQMQCV